MPEHKNNTLSRTTYRRIKAMDREQLSEYVTRAYLSGYEAGRKAATPELLFRTFREVLLSIDSIGPTRADAIMKKLGDTFALRETDAATEDSSGAAPENDGNNADLHDVMTLIEDVLDTLTEAGNGASDEQLHEAADKLFRVRKALKNKELLEVEA